MTFVCHSVEGSKCLAVAFVCHFAECSKCLAMAFVSVTLTELSNLWELMWIYCHWSCRDVLKQRNIVDLDIFKESLLEVASVVCPQIKLVCIGQNNRRYLGH